MTRILSYNILVGGTRRVDQLTKIISSAHPDIVGLVEATDARVVEGLADQLGMQHKMSGNPEHRQDWQIAVLSRLPILRTHAHVRPGILTKPLLEVCIEEKDGHELTVFVTHLAASFYEGRGGNSIRRHEVQEILHIMAAKRGKPHLLIGDFNTIAPGDRLKASVLLRYVLEMDRRYQQNPYTTIGHPYLDFVVPEPLRFLEPLLRVIPRSKVLSALFDWAGSMYAPRDSISLLRKAGYIDCYRRLNPGTQGFTCPASAPAGRIDYIFASPEVAERLAACDVVAEGNGLRGDEASDHLPVVAEFGESVGIGIGIGIETHARFVAPAAELDAPGNFGSDEREEDEDIKRINRVQVIE
jgi:endonuclease/exonuclease/phosphatase family metal-dependent hydrolase